MTHYSPICHVCNDLVDANWVDPETGTVGWCEECRCGVQPLPPNTHTNFNALRNTMRVINQHRRYLASDECARDNDKFHIDISDVLEWNKQWSDELTQFEWNIVKAHLGH